jgi:heme/copper-type cytochrome/quinol oxidase subunit 2
MTIKDDNWHSQETYRSMIGFGTNLLQFCFLANGGATIALLTFVGDLSAKSAQVPDMTLPAVFFVVGIVLAGVAGVLAYFVQFVLFNETPQQAAVGGWRSHVRWLWLALLAIVLSIGAFAAGALTAVSTL